MKTCCICGGELAAGDRSEYVVSSEYVILGERRFCHPQCKKGKDAFDFEPLRHLVARWRQWMDANSSFKTPPLRVVLEYMRNETCEVADVLHREEMPDHARNNDRQHNVFVELADVAMLALTAYPTKHRPPLRRLYTINEFCLEAAFACVLADTSNYVRCLDSILYFIVDYPGMDLRSELLACLDRLGWKHASQGWATARTEILQ